MNGGNYSLHAQVAHLFGILRHERINLAFLQTFNLRRGSIETNKFNLSSEVILFQRQQHSNSGRLVRAKDAVGLAYLVDDVHRRRLSFRYRGAGIAIIDQYLDVWTLFDRLQETFLPRARAGGAFLITQQDYLPLAVEQLSKR